jgi:hypothetical protein
MHTFPAACKTCIYDSSQATEEASSLEAKFLPALNICLEQLVLTVGTTAVLYATDPKKATGELISSLTFSGSLGSGDEYSFSQPPVGKRPIGGKAK